MFVALARRRTRVIRDGGLTVVIANYGPRGGEHVEVTEHVRKRLRNGRLNFAATNENLGGDPFPEVPKSLWIKYRIHEGAPQTIQVDEGTLVVLPDEPS